MAWVTDIVQAANLIGFLACLVYALYIAHRWRWMRLWLAPLIVFLVVGVAFYIVAIFDLYTSPIRTLWSSFLRLFAIMLIGGTLTTLCWMLRERDKQL